MKTICPGKLSEMASISQQKGMQKIFVRQIICQKHVLCGRFLNYSAYAFAMWREANKQSKHATRFGGDTK
jgi:hypothetical protein